MYMYRLIIQSYAGYIYISDIARCAHSLWNIKPTALCKRKKMYSSLMNWERGGHYGAEGGCAGGGEGVQGGVGVCVGGGGRDRGKVWRRGRQLQTTR